MRELRTLGSVRGVSGNRYPYRDPRPATIAGFPVERRMRLLKLPEVSRLTGVPRSSIYWRVTKGEFPRPVKIGERASAWNSDEVEAWIAAKIAAASGKAA